MPARRLNRGYCYPAFLLRSRCSRRFFCRLSRRELLRFWEYSGNYLKLKNIQIGYTLPQYITRKVKIEKVRLYASADNLKTWTKFPGMDPEIGTSITYPLMKQCAFGLQLTF